MISGSSIYLAIFIILPFLYLLLANKEKVSNKVYWFQVFVIILVVGLRGVDIGDDTIVYFDSFDYNMYQDTASYEVSWILICTLVKDVLKLDFQFVLLLYSILTIVPIAYIIREKSPYPFLSLYLLIVIGFVFHSMNVIRAMAAMSFSFLAWYYLEKKKILGVIVSVLLAVFFHGSALINFLFIPLILLFKKTSNPTRIIFLVVSLSIGFLFFSYINEMAGLLSYDKYSKYSSYAEARNANIASMFIVNAISTILTIMFMLNKKINTLYIDVFCLSIILTNFIGYNIGINRILYNITVSLVVAIPQIFKSMESENRPGNLMRLPIYLAYIFIYIAFYVNNISRNVDGVFFGHLD